MARRHVAVARRCSLRYFVVAVLVATLDYGAAAFQEASEESSAEVPEGGIQSAELCSNDGSESCSTSELLSDGSEDAMYTTAVDDDSRMSDLESDGSEDIAGTEQTLSDEGGDDGERVSTSQWDGAGSNFVSAAQLRKVHRKLDKDSNGKASIDEVLEFSQSFSVDLAKQRHGEDVENLLADIDGDQDGEVSLEELVRNLQEQATEIGYETPEELKMLESTKQLEKIKFTASDINGDGLLDKEELLYFNHPHIHAQVFQAVSREHLRRKDSDGDARLNQTEFGSGSADDFVRTDADGDGFLELLEYMDFQSGKVQTQADIRELFARVDQDGDKHVSADELAAMQMKCSDLQAHGLLHEWIQHYEL